MEIITDGLTRLQVVWFIRKCRRGPRVLTPGDEGILDDPMFAHLPWEEIMLAFSNRWRLQ